MKIKDLFVFVAGACVGALACKKYFKTVYEERLEEEVASVKKKQTEIMNPVEEKTEETVEESMLGYVDRVNKTGYVSYSKATPDVKEAPKPKHQTISPTKADEYVSDEGYSSIQLNVYPNGYICNSKTGEEFENLASIGEGNLDKFGEYEKDSVYILNKDEKTVYALFLADDSPEMEN